MYTEAIKIQLIEEVLKVKSESVLEELETVLKNKKKVKINKSVSAHDFLGSWSKKDARLMEKAIEETCEQIHENDWK